MAHKSGFRSYVNRARQRNPCQNQKGDTDIRIQGIGQSFSFTHCSRTTPKTIFTIWHIRRAIATSYYYYISTSFPQVVIINSNNYYYYEGPLHTQPIRIFPLCPYNCRSIRIYRSYFWTLILFYKERNSSHYCILCWGLVNIKFNTFLDRLVIL